MKMTQDLLDKVLALRNHINMALWKDEPKSATERREALEAIYAKAEDVCSEVLNSWARE